MKSHTLTVKNKPVMLVDITIDDLFNVSCTVSGHGMFGHVTRYVEGYTRWTTPELWDYDVQTAVAEFLKQYQYEETCKAVKKIS